MGKRSSRNKLSSKFSLSMIFQGTLECTLCQFLPPGVRELGSCTPHTLGSQGYLCCDNVNYEVVPVTQIQFIGGSAKCELLGIQLAAEDKCTQL